MQCRLKQAAGAGNGKNVSLITLTKDIALTKVSVPVISTLVDAGFKIPYLLPRIKKCRAS